MPDPIATKVGIRVECVVCRRQKSPRGRSTPLGMVCCDRNCKGYALDPQVGSLWPGETDEGFGYECGDNGTKPVLLCDAQTELGRSDDAELQADADAQRAEDIREYESERIASIGVERSPRMLADCEIGRRR